MDLSQLVTQLDSTLDVEAYAAVDASANGLQVGPETATVDHVAVAVDGVVETAERAAAVDADLLCVHHGIVWGGIDRVTGQDYDRVRAFLENDLALYAAHLPLDGHPDLGNAAQLARRLELAAVEPFGEVGPVYAGRRGTLRDPVDLPGLRESVADALPIETDAIDVIDHGPAAIEDVAIVTGDGSDHVREARAAGVDAFVTGEVEQKTYHEAREAGLSVLVAGHYATETLGVRALMALLEDMGLETSWIDVPTGL